MNLILLCPQHKQPVLQACIDIECTHFPFMCKLCLQDQPQLHSKHSFNLKSYDHYLQLMSKYVEDNMLEQPKFKDLFQKQQTLMKYFSSPDDHLNNLEGFIRTTKVQIQSDFKEVIDNFVNLLTCERDIIIDKLDNYIATYKTNFCNVKEVVEPIHFFINRCKYYCNQNNLKVLKSSYQLKLHTQPSIGTQIKMSLKSIQQIPKAEQLRNTFDSINNAQVPIKFESVDFRQTAQESMNQIKDFFRKKVQILTIEPIEIPELNISQQATPKKIVLDQEIPEDTKTMPPPVEEISKETTQPIPTISNIQILDQRIIEDLTPSPYFKQQKFKIKKKLSLEIIVTSLAIVGQSQVVLGLSDGSLKLLDLTTSKVSFYPNTYINHQQEVNSLIVLKQVRGTRLASTSNENYVIIWTLGENYVPYPERKLIGFKQNVVRIMDLSDGAHVVCQSPNNLNIVNYNDNRMAHSFENKIPIIEFLYVSKFSKFATVSQNNIVSIYNLKMSNLQGAMLLINCELEHSISALHIANISACIAVETNNDIVLCYGCLDGSVKLFNVLKNAIIGDIQLFNSKIIELFILKNKKGFTLIVLGENDKAIKAIQFEGKLNVVDKFGELLEACAKCQGKNTIQPFYRNQNKCALLILNETQREIGLYELC